MMKSMINNYLDKRFLLDIDLLFNGKKMSDSTGSSVWYQQ